MKQATHLRFCNSIGWRCATCCQLITSVSDGWVEWLASEDDGGGTILNGLRLVHRESCRYDPGAVFRNGRSVVEGLSLERFVGPDGLILLLSLLVAGELPMAEVVELAKRVQIPGYELARNLVGKKSFTDPSTSVGARMLPASGNSGVAYIGNERPRSGLKRARCQTCFSWRWFWGRIREQSLRERPIWRTAIGSSQYGSALAQLG